MRGKEGKGREGIWGVSPVVSRFVSSQKGPITSPGKTETETETKQLKKRPCMKTKWEKENRKPSKILSSQTSTEDKATGQKGGPLKWEVKEKRQHWSTQD